MVKVLIIADDFTGALDTGTQFAQMGIETHVFVGQELPQGPFETDCQVVVLNTETRHLSPKAAYDVVHRVAKAAFAAGVEILYKKTDSALRGCVGSELAALMDAAGEEVYFLPALPWAGRTTVGGVQYVDGVPVAESVFGKDPFEPVRTSLVPELLRSQAEMEVSVVGTDDIARFHPGKDPRVVVFDASSDADLRATANRLQGQGKLRAVAGCAGLAAILPDYVDFRQSAPPAPRVTQGMLVVCGSLNPITLRQLDVAEAGGFARMHLNLAEMELAGYFDTAEGRAFLEQLHTACLEKERVILDTLGSAPQGDDAQMQNRRFAIAEHLGELVRRWTKFGLDQTVLLTGGDTLMGFMHQMQGARLRPVCEIDQGAIVSHLPMQGQALQVISKSGGFGSEQVFLRIAAEVIAGAPARTAEQGGV